MKIFCIGFHKTGTKSLETALKTLGYRVTGPNGVRDPDIASNVMSLVEDLVPQYDAFRDNPWPIVYAELDSRYQGSKFVLTERDPASWYTSVANHFGSKTTPMRTWIYGEGSPAGHRALYVRRFVDHCEQVKEHFRDRPDDLLTINLASGHGWPELCRFLGREAPNIPFPHEHRAWDRK